MKAAYFALGCKVNSCDTGQIKKLLCDMGIPQADEGEAADVVIVNTCCVTNESERKSAQLIRRQKSANPGAVVLVCGCFARTDPERVKRVSGADIVVSEKSVEAVGRALQDYLSSRCNIIQNASDEENTIPNTAEKEKNTSFEITTDTDKTRANIKIQDGCRMFCSYCIIPFARGDIRSAEADKVIAKINELVAMGYKEVVLTGIHLASYKSEEIGLIELIEAIAEKCSLPRLRLGSLEPNILTKDFILRASRVSCLCPHFHISLQSGCDEILSRMNRKYNSALYEKVCCDIREAMPNAEITTDIIVGFPGESDEMFRETCEFVEKIGFAHVHVFPFSPKKGTKAEKMAAQLSGQAKHARALMLIKASEHTAQIRLKGQIGSLHEVLFEQPIGEGCYEGYSENYLPVKVKSAESLCGEIKKVEITDVDARFLIGRLIVEDRA